MPLKKSLAWETTFFLKDKAKERAFNLKNDTPLIALYVAEFILTLVLVAAILLYLDGRFNQIEFPFNLFIFAAILFGVMHFYNYTKPFREWRGIKRESSFRAFMLEFVIFAIVVVSGYIYQDPTINIIPYPFNFLVFLAALSVPLYFYVNEKFIE